MSSTLMWRPNKAKGDLPDELKYKLKLQGERIFDSTDVPYLQGLADCNVKGATKLIELIKKYGEIVLKESY